MIDTILGPVLGVLKWLVELLFKSRGASQAQSREHDLALFRKGDAAVNESFLDDLLNSDLYNHWCDIDNIRAVRHFWQDFEREENRFLDRKVRKAALAAIRALHDVDSFVAKNFFMSRLPNDEGRLFLYPELREAADEEERARYWRFASDLNTLLGTAWELYKKYRATVKKRLMV